MTPHPPIELPATAAVDYETAIRWAVSWLAENGRVPAERRDEILSAVLRRERLGSTAIGRGVGIPHATIDGLSEPIVSAVFHAATGIPAPERAIDREPIRRMVLVLSVRGLRGLRALEEAVRRLRE